MVEDTSILEDTYVVEDTLYIEDTSIDLENIQVSRDVSPFEDKPRAIEDLNPTEDIPFLQISSSPDASGSANHPLTSIITMLEA